MFSKQNLATSEVMWNAIIGYYALLRQYTKRMILQIGAEGYVVFRDFLATADINALINKEIIWRAYQRISYTSREIQTNSNSVRIISMTWENNFKREIQFSEIDSSE
jgi:ABC-type multidrug transport system permease subunit